VNEDLKLLLESYKVSGRLGCGDPRDVRKIFHMCQSRLLPRTLSRREDLGTGYPGIESGVEPCPSYRHDGILASEGCSQGIQS